MAASEPSAQGSAPRGSTPVRVYDRRVVYYPSGVAGVGKRQSERLPDSAAAQARVAELRALLANGGSVNTGLPFHRLMADLIEHRRLVGAPTGTINQYRSNWNCWVPEDVRLLPCGELQRFHWNRILDFMVEGGASKQTVKAVTRTLGAVNTFGADRGYFANESEPFHTSADARRAAAERAMSAARDGSDRDDGWYAGAVCPTMEQVEAYAGAFESLYPGYGRRLVLTGYATGLRIGELLALKSGNVDLDQAIITVDAQLDRHEDWPATRLPKGRKKRTAIMWAWFLPTAASLVHDADGSTDDRGALFPPSPGVARWLDHVGHLATEAADLAGWEWTFHWLRHAFASVSLAPETSGGYGLPLVSVSKWLGHSKPSITQDMYVVRQQDDATTAKAATERIPGTSEGRPTQDRARA